MTAVEEMLSLLYTAKTKTKNNLQSPLNQNPIEPQGIYHGSIFNLNKNYIEGDLQYKIYLTSVHYFMLFSQIRESFYYLKTSKIKILHL